MELELLVIMLCILINSIAYYWDLFKNHEVNDD
jgi:hypothetical protein